MTESEMMEYIRVNSISPFQAVMRLSEKLKRCEDRLQQIASGSIPYVLPHQSGNWGVSSYVADYAREYFKEVSDDQ